MKLNVAGLRDGTSDHVHQDVNLVLDQPPEGVAFTGPFTGSIDAYGDRSSILVHVDLKGSARLECARCLTPVVATVRVKFDEEFRPGTPNPNGEMEEDEEGNVYSLYAGDAVNLTEAIRQEILVDVPLKALCKSDCAGLCTICGGNKNEQQCSCHRTEVDPRLAKLRELLPPDHE